MTVARPDYVFFSQNANIAKDRSAHVEAGVLRFLYDARANDGFFGRQRDYARKSLAGKEYEIVRVTDGDATVEDARGRVTTEPVWRLGRDSQLLLAGLLRDHDRVFVENLITHHRLAAHSGPERRMLRELWETIQFNPDKEFIVFGRYAFQLYFLFGMSGGAFSIRENWTHMDRATVGPIVNIDGTLIYPRDFAEIDWFTNPYIHNKGMSGNIVYNALQLLKAVPDYLADFYDSKDPIGITVDDLREHFSLWKRLSTKHFMHTSTANTGPHNSLWFTEGDRILCDSCTLKYACRLYKEGSVCILPETDSQRLASYFGTRKSDDVLEGLAKIVQFSAERFETAVEDENVRREACEKSGDAFERDPEVGKMANDLFKNAAAYAKLLNPALTKPQVQVGIIAGGGVQQVRLERGDVTPAMAAGAARELEKGGISRDKQNPDMIFDFLARQHEQPAIEGEIVDGMRNDY